MTEIKTFYINQLATLLQKDEALSKNIRLVSWARLVVFLLLVALAFAFANSGNPYWIVGLVLSMVTLVWLILFHQRLYHISASTKLTIEIIENEQASLELQPKLFDDGKRFTELLPFADDLDLFGKRSLFHQINRCSTNGGQQLLAGSLIQSSTDSETISQRQEAVAWISQKPAFRLQFMLKLLQAFRKKEDIATERIPNSDAWFFNKTFYKIAAVLLPLIVISTLIIALFTNNYSLFILNGSIAFFLAFAQNKKMLLLSDELNGMGRNFKVYSEVLQLYMKEQPQGIWLQSIHTRAEDAAAALKLLSRISEWFDRRNNLILYSFGNLFLQYDILLGLRYEAWKRKHQKNLEQWLQAVWELEWLVSMGTFAFNHPEAIKPEILTDDGLEAENLMHPLMPAGQCIPNDIKLEKVHPLHLITGSNMSGKSTWLRTLGVNVLLAQAGMPVFASKFLWKPMPVLSSLRQSDSLFENTSLFMNELKQLQNIIRQAETGISCLILLDEVLRGTNSDDKYTGSKALIQKLIQTNSFIIIASHDLKLSELEEDTKQLVINYCFESKLEGGQLLFDYSLRKGVARNRNATWLMQQMGIIDAEVES